jgi:N-acyl-D-amino-acid deacylase
LPQDSHPHPRLWGSFPRVLGHYCRDEKLFSLPEAIHKMTGLSAQNFGLKQRGKIAQDFWADLVIFDPATIADQATFAQPKQAAIGIHWVLVNGEIALDQNGPTGSRRGQVISR